MAGFNLRNTVDGIVDYKRKWDNAKATGKGTSEFEKGAAAYYQELRDNGRGDVADYLQKSDSITAGEYLNTLTPDYQATAGDLQKKSNDVYDWTKGAGSQIAKDYDMVYQTIGVTPTRTDYGKDILSGYGLAADAAYKSSLGGGAENNGGNVDSYAAAQANRNKAAMVKEGYGTVLDYYNSIAGNATKWAGDKANALGGFAGLMQGNVTDDRDTVEKAFTGTVDLWKTQDTNKTEKEVAELGAEISREQMAQEKLIADEANMTELLVQQLKNDAKSSSSGKVASSPQFNASSVVDNIINRHTKGTYAIVEDDGVTKKYEKDGKTTDLEAVAVDLQAMIDDESIPYAQRVSIFNEAKLEGIGVLAPAAEGTVRPEEIKDNRILNHFASLPNNNERLIHLNGLVADKTLSPGQAQWLIDKYGITI